MPTRRLLLLSNSQNEGQGYLEHARSIIKDFLGGEIKKALFVPFARVLPSFDEYASKARAGFQQMGYGLDSLHEAADQNKAIAEAEAIVIGGGNTFHLLNKLYEADLLEVIRRKVNEGTPYIGWSAGSNIACPTIRTTNDMPIVEPPSFNALKAVPFQLNPHYVDGLPPGYPGETREERIAEFVEVNPNVYVVGLREGSILRVEGSVIKLFGANGVRVFAKGKDFLNYEGEESLQFLLTPQTSE